MPINNNKKENILILSAHSDDFVLGAGGTIAKYSKEGHKINSIVFSYGEKSHPWLKDKEVQKMRAKEAFDAGDVIGCKVKFFNLKEMNFNQGAKKKKISEQLIYFITKNKINKVFTHSSEDPHPDHQAVNKITIEAIKKITIKKKPEVYIYSVWNPVEFNTRFPALYIDISKTFSSKIKSLKQFPSQKFHAIYPLMFIVFFRAIKNGIKIRKMFAEKFYRIL